MIVTFLSANRLLFCFLLSTYRWKRKIVHSHSQEMARKHSWQFLSKLSPSSLPLKSGLGTFLSEWRHSRSHILFVICDDVIYNVSGGSTGRVRAPSPPPPYFWRKKKKWLKEEKPAGQVKQTPLKVWIRHWMSHTSFGKSLSLPSGVAILAKTSQALW